MEQKPTTNKMQSYLVLYAQKFHIQYILFYCLQTPFFLIFLLIFFYFLVSQRIMSGSTKKQKVDQNSKLEKGGKEINCFFVW